MDEVKILNQLILSLSSLFKQIEDTSLSSDEIKKLVITSERSFETLKNYYLKSNDYKSLIENLIYLIKAIKHFFRITRSVNTCIENEKELNKWLLNEIKRIISQLENLREGTF
jgi:hypothetical protein